MSVRMVNGLYETGKGITYLIYISIGIGIGIGTEIIIDNRLYTSFCYDCPIYHQFCIFSET